MIRPRSERTATVALILLVVLALFPGVAAAQQQSGASVVVEEGETHEGDLEAFSGNVVVHGRVTGDVNAAAGNVRIDGTVDGNVEVAAGNVYLGPNATVGGNLEAAAGNVVIAGTIDGDVDAAAETITLASTASIGGDLTYGGTLEREDGATVAGTVSQGDAQVAPFGGMGPSIPGWAFTVYGFLVNAVLGAVLLLAFPAFSRTVADRAVDAPARSTGFGLLALIAVPIGLVVLMLTIVGIPLSLIGFVLFGLSLWVGAVYGRFAVGVWLLDVADVDNRWLALVAGLVVVAAVGLVPVVGGLVELLVVLLGFGALATALNRRYRGGAPESPAGGGPQTTPDRDGQPT